MFRLCHRLSAARFLQRSLLETVYKTRNLSQADRSEQ